VWDKGRDERKRVKGRLRKGRGRKEKRDKG